MSQQINKRLLCCFRLTTSHTVGREVKKDQHIKDKRLFPPRPFFWFLTFGASSRRAVTCVAACLPHHSQAAAGQSSKSKAGLPGGQQGAPLSPPVHMHNGKAANCQSTLALSRPPNLQRSRLSLCTTFSSFCTRAAKTLSTTSLGRSRTVNKEEFL